MPSKFKKTGTLLLAVSLAAIPATSIAETGKASLVVEADKPGPVIAPEIYGQFAEHLGTGIYGGIWVGENSSIPNTRGIRNDVIDALRKLKVPVIRWPGGCFADEYHWKDGIGPRDQRPGMINNNWGGVVENNAFGTHEFMDFCELIGAQPYICGNLGSGSVQEMKEWDEYMTSDAQSPMANLRRANGRDKPWKVKYFAVGNENWGCGGRMTPEYYCDNYNRYSAFLKDYSGNKLTRVACGPGEGDYNWTQVCMDRISNIIDALSLHSYTLPTGDWSHKGSATDFDESEWFATLKRTLRMETLLNGHSAIMDKTDPEKRIAIFVDEWGTWCDPTPGSNPGFLQQQNSLRDAVLAAINLHIFQAHADRVRMANIAQMINVLQAMILTDGPKMVCTPTYYTFEMLNVHQGATYLPVKLQCPDYSYGDDSMPAVSAGASRDSNGLIHISFANVDPNNAIEVSCTFEGASEGSVSGRVLTADTINAYNTFDNPDAVSPVAFDGATIQDGVLKVTLPSKSVVILELTPAK